MKVTKGLIGLLFFILVFALTATAGATDFSGTYTYKATKSTLTLTLSQDRQGNLSGLLSSTTGAKFQVTGLAEGNVAKGECRVGSKGGAPFEAHFEGTSLLFTIINAKKKRNTVIRFTAVRKSRPQAETVPKTAVPPGGNGHGSFHFGNDQKPQSSHKTQRPQNPLLGNWICITPNGTLTLRFLSENRLAFNGSPANYTATRDRITVQADGQTFVYPYTFSNGRLIITFPNGVRTRFVRDTEQRQAAPASGKIYPELVGRWKDIRSSGNTVIVLMGNGQYTYYSDYTAGNSTQDQTNWGYGHSASDRGTWQAFGTPAAGTIRYTSQDGGSGTLSYQAHVENGQTYWREYYFDGKLYVKQ